MKRRWKIGGLVVGSMALVALVILTMAAPVFAQDTTEGQTVKPRLGGFGGWFRPGSWGSFDTTAEALGLSPTELFSELHSGKTIEQIAEEKGVDLATIHEAAQAARTAEMKARIEQAVTDGTLTREQADWMLKGLDQGWMGGRGMGGKGMRFRGWCPPGPAAPSGGVRWNRGGSENSLTT